MFRLYAWLKFIHVASVAGWLGGFAAIGLMNVLASRRAEPSDVAAFAEQGTLLGARLVGPASGLAILSGIGGMFVGHVPFRAWNVWGMLAVVLFSLVGIATMRPTLARLEAGAESGAPPDELRRLLRRHRGLLALNVLILLSALWAMVLKPT